MEAKNLNPLFDDLNNPDTFINHVEQLVKKNRTTPHAEILQQLIEQFEPLDFRLLAFPEVEQLSNQLKNLNPESENAKETRNRLDKIKVNTKHFLVLSIENALLIAEKNRWGLCKNQDFIYLFNGTFWEDLDKDTFQKFLGEASEQMGVKKFDARFYEFREKLFRVCL